ncbi:MAG: transcription elongation factor GreB, partial [Pseudomonadales bacterium]|nr:transcription elongation factor GreB [Pseudomonadales bacterium]
MSRPAPYITAEGAAALQAELRYLWKEKRPDVTRRVSEAAAMGDRSENAEYIYGKKQLREIDRRIRYLSKRLDEVVIVDRRPSDETRAYFGAWVEL